MEARTSYPGNSRRLLSNDFGRMRSATSSTAKSMDAGTFIGSISPASFGTPTLPKLSDESSRPNSGNMYGQVG